MNVDLLADLTKHNQTQHFIHKLKLQKTEKDNNNKERRKNKESTKSHLLNLQISIRGPEALSEYEIYGELGKGAYGVVRMGVSKKSGEKVAIKFYPKKHLDEMNRLKNL